MKYTHEHVHYRAGQRGKRCAVCSMYEAKTKNDDAHCSAVEDPIYANGVCDIFKPASHIGRKLAGVE